ncbi:hypothetical protein [Brachybacterium sacelli]|uniref:hypothetical protein n=1 Tax=Brachybacterium sacelli TaxID=173364 RepID=UPI0036081C12
MRPLLAASAAVGLTGLGAGAADHLWSRHVEIHRYTLREFELRILPPGTRTVRVLHLSDIHLMPDQDRKLAFLEHLSALRRHPWSSTPGTTSPRPPRCRCSPRPSIPCCVGRAPS